MNTCQANGAQRKLQILHILQKYITTYYYNYVIIILHYGKVNYTVETKIS